MSGSIENPLAWAPTAEAQTAAQTDEPIIRFSISPTGSGAWLWSARDAQGRIRAQGRAATRKLAAALVIHHIVCACACAQRAAPPSQPLHARAA
jgi:hypothetical protein